MRLLLITPTLSGNSLGRTYCIDLLARAAGWPCETWSAAGDAVWGPLEEDPFAATCHRTHLDGVAAVPELAERAAEADLIIAIKPLPESLGLAWQVHRRTGVPLMVDIDDPDIDVLLATGRPVKALAKRLLRPKVVRSARTMRALAHDLPRMVSNPELQRRHGGTVVPHVRVLTPRAARPLDPEVIDVAFVGSVQAHKGLGVLREAVARVASQGFRLTVTAVAPPDARGHERWIGRTTLGEGLDLVASAHIVVIPSLPTPWAVGQLPVKLIDAMLLGAGLVVSDLPPLPWAVGPAGIVVEPNDAGALADALLLLREPRELADRSARLRALAERRYTLGANLDTFRDLCGQAIRSTGAGRSQRPAP